MEVEHVWRYFQTFLEQHGWRLLGAVVVLYVLKNKYSAYATRKHIQRTLAEANDPQRVEVLRREAMRVRKQQQQRLADTQPRPKNKKTTTTKTEKLH